MKVSLPIIALLLISSTAFCQPEEELTYVMRSSERSSASVVMEIGSQAYATFGSMSADRSVDDDFSQVIFIALPISFTDSVHIRLFDPDCGGTLDRRNGPWETNTIFELFGGQGSLSHADARSLDPTGNYKSGTSLKRTIFGPESLLDNRWSLWHSFLASDGEQLDQFPGFGFFKIVVEGRTGNDGNIYSLFLSSQPDSNIEITGAEHFEFESIVFQDGKLQRLLAPHEVLSASGIVLPVELTLPEQVTPEVTKPDFQFEVTPIDQ